MKACLSASLSARQPVERNGRDDGRCSLLDESGGRMSCLHQAIFAVQIAPKVKVNLAPKRVLMHRGFDRLAADVAQVLRTGSHSGAWPSRSERVEETMRRFSPTPDTYDPGGTMDRVIGRAQPKSERAQSSRSCTLAGDR
jgi:hypothetical protein